MPLRAARLACLLALGFGAAACGVRVRDPEPGTEFWESIEVSGTFVPGGALQVVAEYEQLYPVDVEVACELRRETEQLAEIGRTVIPALPNGHPDATPAAGVLSYEFTAPDRAGLYIVECLTPTEEDNFIGDEIRVG